MSGSLLLCSVLMLTLPCYIIFTFANGEVYVIVGGICTLFEQKIYGRLDFGSSD